MIKQLIVYLYLLAAGQGFFLTFLIAFSGKFRNKSLAFFTGLLTFLFSYNVLYYFLAYSGIIRDIPHLFATHIPLILLYGPLLLMIFSMAVKSEFKWKPVHLLHLLPFIAFMYLLSRLYLLPADVKLNIYNEDMRTNGIYPFHLVSFLINMGVAVHLGIYMVFCYRVIRRANYTLSAPLLAAPVAFAVLNFIYHSMHFVGVSYSSYLCYGVKVALGVCVYTIAYTVYRNGGTIEPVPVKVKYKTSGLDTDTSKLLSERILAELQRPDIYLDTTINLKTLSERMNYPPQYISQSVNEHFQVGFPDLLNKIRVEHAKKLLAESNEKILSIAYSSGFNNKVSFINAFRKYTGTTPLAYRNMLAEKPAESAVVEFGMGHLENLSPKEA